MPRAPRVALSQTVRYPLDPMNDESHLLLPDDLDLTNVEDIVSAFAPELRPARWNRRELIGVSFFILACLSSAIMLFPQGPIASFIGSSPFMLLAWIDALPLG